jgi:PTS system mannose-specific IIA component
MIGKLLLTHGGLARELLAAADKISGRLSGFEALSLDWGEEFEQARSRVGEVLARLDQGHGVLILTDVYGSTPSNIAMTFYQPGKVEVLAGVNLPMILRMTCQSGMDGGKTVSELARLLQEKGKRGVCLASDLEEERKCTFKRVVEAVTGAKTHD